MCAAGFRAPLPPPPRLHIMGYGLEGRIHRGSAITHADTQNGLRRAQTPPPCAACEKCRQDQRELPFPPSHFSGKKRKISACNRYYRCFTVGIQENMSLYSNRTTIDNGCVMILLNNSISIIFVADSMLILIHIEHRFFDLK